MDVVCSLLFLAISQTESALFCSFFNGQKNWRRLSVLFLFHFYRILKFSPLFLLSHHCFTPVGCHSFFIYLILSQAPLLVLFTFKPLPCSQHHELPSPTCVQYFGTQCYQAVSFRHDFVFHLGALYLLALFLSLPPLATPTGLQQWELHWNLAYFSTYY